MHVYLKERLQISFRRKMNIYVTTHIIKKQDKTKQKIPLCKTITFNRVSQTHALLDLLSLTKAPGLAVDGIL